MEKTINNQVSSSKLKLCKALCDVLSQYTRGVKLKHLVDKNTKL